LPIESINERLIPQFYFFLLSFDEL
jgi:hypothetical protein